MREREEGLAGTVLDLKHADVCSAGGDDLPAARVEFAGVEITLHLLVPPPGRGDVVTHGGLMQLEAELAVGGCGRPQCDGGHAAACPGRSTSLPLMKVAPPRTRATRCGALTMRQRSWADSMSLKAMARPAAREPGALVTLVRCRTVAKVDSGSWCAGAPSARR